MGRSARRVAETTYSEEDHLRRLEAVFVELTQLKAHKN
jgi:hypothetical protein